MQKIRPIKLQTTKQLKLSSNKTNNTESLTSGEMGKLWATYMGNRISKCIIGNYLQYVEEQDIKIFLENALRVSMELLKTTEEILKKENLPIPKGFSEEDLNASAPRIFEDEYYFHYFKYATKAGMSIYNFAVPLVFRKDVEAFFTYCMESNMAWVKQIKEILMNRGLIKPPINLYNKAPPIIMSSAIG